MNSQISHKSKLLDTSTSQSAYNWHMLLDLQTKMFFPKELSYYLNCDTWHKAKSVLDVGCGNGAYISEISKYFPEKSYTGIDISSELISIACNENAKKNVNYEVQDFYQFQTDELFDIIVMRLIVQHLSDFPFLLNHAAKLLRPNGSLVIIEPNLIDCWNHPETPKFDKFLRRVNDHSVQNNTNRCLLSELGCVANSVRGWSVADDVSSIIPFVGPFEDSDILSLYNLWIDILEDSQIISLSNHEVRSELRSWSQRTDSYAQIGIKFLKLMHSP